jgi:hypothetical protein
MTTPTMREAVNRLLTSAVWQHASVIDVSFAENADLAGGEETGRHEYLIFTLHHVVVEAEVVLLDQRSTDQLVWRQRSPDTVSDDVSVRHCFAETRSSLWSADPADPANHDVGVLLSGQVDKPPQRVGSKVVISIMKEDKLSARLGQRAVAASARPPAVWLPEDLDVGPLRCQITEMAPGVIGRAIVDDQNLDQVGGQSLGC